MFAEPRVYYREDLVSGEKLICKAKEEFFGKNPFRVGVKVDIVMVISHYTFRRCL
jgi:hypothetical protein